MIFALLLLSLLGWLLYRFRIRTAAQAGELKPLALPVVVLTVFYLAIAGFALLERASLSRPDRLAASPPSLQHLQAAHGDVLVEGRVSRSNPPVHGDHVACFESADDDASTVRNTPAFKIQLGDGEIPLENDDYQLLDWHSARTVGCVEYFLRADDVVVIDGEMVRGVVLLGPRSGQPTVGIRARTIFLGRSGDYLAAARRAARVPGWLSLATLAGCLAAAVFLPMAFLAAWWRLRRAPGPAPVDR